MQSTANPRVLPLILLCLGADIIFTIEKLGVKSAKQSKTKESKPTPIEQNMASEGDTTPSKIRNTDEQQRFLTNVDGDGTVDNHDLMIIPAASAKDNVKQSLVRPAKIRKCKETLQIDMAHGNMLVIAAGDSISVCWTLLSAMHSADVLICSIL